MWRGIAAPTTARSTIRACPACGDDTPTPAGEMGGWALGACPRCGTRFTAVAPSPDELRELYGRLYTEGETYQMHLDELKRLGATGKNAAGGLYRSAIFLRRYQPDVGDRMLEVGCGNGMFLLLARDRGWTVEGIDLSGSAIRAGRETHGLPVQEADFAHYDAEPGTYRAIVAWEVLEHLPDPRGFLDKARTLLRPDGSLVFSVPNEGPKVPHPETRGPASLPPVHLNFWNPDSVRAFLELNGYRVDRLIVQRSMLSLADPRRAPRRFARLQAGALLRRYEGLQLFVAATPA